MLCLRLASSDPALKDSASPTSSSPMHVQTGAKSGEVSTDATREPAAQLCILLSRQKCRSMMEILHSSRHCVSSLPALAAWAASEVNLTAGSPYSQERILQGRAQTNFVRFYFSPLGRLWQFMCMFERLERFQRLLRAEEPKLVRDASRYFLLVYHSMPSGLSRIEQFFCSQKGLGV